MNDILPASAGVDIASTSTQIMAAVKWPAIIICGTLLAFLVLERLIDILSVRRGGV